MINIIPRNDLFPHEEDSTCECNPSLMIENGEMILVHHSFDGRENIEEGGMEHSTHEPEYKNHNKTKDND